jgi:hypothetical protein
MLLLQSRRPLALTMMMQTDRLALALLLLQKEQVTTCPAAATA